MLKTNNNKPLKQKEIVAYNKTYECQYCGKKGHTEVYCVDALNEFSKRFDKFK